MTANEIIEWMSAHGRPCYEIKIQAIEAQKHETIGDAGRYWASCPFTREQLDKLDSELQEVKQAAIDRYEDWASD